MYLLRKSDTDSKIIIAQVCIVGIYLVSNGHGLSYKSHVTFDFSRLPLLQVAVKHHTISKHTP